MERKTAAVFISDLYSDMVMQTVKGAIDSARSHNAKLLFFTSFTDNYSSEQYDRYKDYDTGDFVVYLLPDLSEYDALISFDTYMPIMYIDQMDRLKRTAPCPVISLGAVKEGACSVVNAQDYALRDLIEHVIQHHGCRDLVHVAGHPELSFVQERISVFRRTLADHGLPCGEERIFYGNLAPSCGEEIVEQIMARYEARGGRKLPDAIICANDYMAIGVIQALEDRGCQVPRDVIVTGYDDILRAQFNEPSITTSAQPFERVGWEGMEALVRLWNGERVDSVIAVPSRMMLRQSCGCEPFRVYKKDTIRDKYINLVTRLESLALSNTNMILGASMDETLPDILEEIENSCLRDTGFKDAVLCLIDGWDKKRVIKDRDELKNETFEVVCGVLRGKPVRRQRLKKGALLPDDMLADPEPYFILPIHHMQYFMGYFIVSLTMESLGQLHTKSWLVSVSTVLENWCIRRQLTDSVSKLDHLYQTDMLTGLYNRRGYNRYFESYYESCRRQRTELAVFLIDMNHMKVVNDNYGHVEGDYCLCAIADALQTCAFDDEICSRTGGDEFVVLARNCDAARAEAYVRTVREEIVRRCERDGKPYTVTISVGCCRKVPGEDERISIQHEAEAFLRNADKAMYEEKRRRE